jgi:hypothetical protein
VRGEPGTELTIVPVEIPTLTEEQVTVATKVLSEDDQARVVLNSLKYTLEDPSPVLNDKYTVTAVHLTVVLDEPLSPLSVTGQWRATAADSTSALGYREKTTAITTQTVARYKPGAGVRRFSVLVDVERHRLIEFAPLIEELVDEGVPGPSPAPSLPAQS